MDDIISSVKLRVTQDLEKDENENFKSVIQIKSIKLNDITHSWEARMDSNSRRKGLSFGLV